MSNQVGSVNNVSGPKISDQLPASALEHGALTIFEDQEVVFTGNGKNTPADVMARVIERQAEAGDGELLYFSKSRDAALHAARHALEKYNPHLKEKDADAPVPAGEQFYAQAGDDLKKLLAPFKNRLDELREVVVQSKTGMGGRNEATGHGVFSQGLDLPVGKEPEPTADPAEVMARLGIKPG